MDRNLSQALLHLYTRQRKRIFFQNGMTLNQLALEMWERLGYREIDPSVLSRVLRGERFFSKRQLIIFCDILGIKPVARERLFCLLSQDILSKAGIESATSLPASDRLEFVKDCEKYINLLEDTGNAVMAYDLASFLAEKAFEIASTAKKDKEKRRAFTLTGHLEWERGYSQTLLLLPKTTLNSTMCIWKRINNIAKELKDKEISNLALMGEGFASFVDENYEKAIKNVNQALTSISNIEYKMKAYKVLAASYSYVGNEEAFKDLCQTVNRLINGNNINPSLLCEALDCMGRGGALLNVPNSEQYLEQVQKIVENSEKTDHRLVFRKIQLIRSRLEIQAKAKKTGRKVNKNIIEKEGLIGYELATNLGYKRHAKKIEKFMRKLLD